MWADSYILHKQITDFRAAPTGLSRNPIICTDFALLIHRKRSPFPAGEGFISSKLQIFEPPVKMARKSLWRMPRSFATLEDEGTSAANASIRRGVGILQFARI